VAGDFELQGLCEAKFFQSKTRASTLPCIYEAHFSTKLVCAKNGFHVKAGKEEKKIYPLHLLAYSRVQGQIRIFLLW